MPLQTHLSGLITAIGSDIKAINAALSGKAATQHAGTHAVGGSDQVTAASIGGLMDPPFHSSVSRVVDTSYQPSTVRPTLVIASIIFLVPGYSRAIMYVKVGNPVGTIARELLYVYGPDQIVSYRTITFLVPVGFYYMFAAVPVLGTPTIGIDRVFEQQL